jgi:UDP-glucose:(heptosyl)LPS alpha-1,3-glucosyltransferase
VKITLVTPAVSRAGGTEKCMSWLAEDLAALTEIAVVTADFRQTDLAASRVHRIRTIPRPRLLAYLTFLAGNTLYLALRRGRRLVLATSGDCLYSDIVYAHFCCAAYLELIRGGTVELPSTTPRQRLRNYHYRLFLTVASAVEKRIYKSRRVQSVIAVSGGVKDEIVAHYGVDPSRIRVVVNAADDRVRLSKDKRTQVRSDMRGKMNIKDSEIVLLFVAAGDWKRKGLALVIDALAELNMPAVQLLVAGDEDIQYYAGLVRRRGVTAQVRFLGSVAELESIYACADVFVYPSAYEAFPLVVLEAAASGLPLVVTRTNGTEEIVADGENGILVERQTDAIASAIRKLAADKELRATMGERARISSQPYTRAAVAHAILEICQSAADGPSR